MSKIDHVWTSRGWLRDVAFADAGELIHARFALPGMPNLHSHAFQRAMAGTAERRSPGGDSFWTWRRAMYALASRIGPDELKAIAAELYVEMLKAGYTHVCEFHYLHNAPGGHPYADPTVMSKAIIEAARESGIGLTLLPVLYLTGGFNGRPLNEGQQRFGLSIDAYLALIESLRAWEIPRVRVGIALHSLRAVPEYAMREVLATPLAADCPVHLHIAEQTGEVEECVRFRGTRPVRWLFEHTDVNEHWCLVHATHLENDEARLLAKSGAVAGLCPTTEANLGDGLFPLSEYLSTGGTLGFGSDSQISVSPVEEVRWLEYGQRLATRRRNVAACGPGASVGEALWAAGLLGGARASGLVAPSDVGDPLADCIVLNEESTWFAGRTEHDVIDTFLFAGNEPRVRAVRAGGTWVVRDFRHRAETAIASCYKEVVTRLQAST